MRFVLGSTKYADWVISVAHQHPTLWLLFVCRVKVAYADTAYGSTNCRALDSSFILVLARKYCHGRHLIALNTNHILASCICSSIPDKTTESESESQPPNPSSDVIHGCAGLASNAIGKLAA